MKRLGKTFRALLQRPVPPPLCVAPCCSCSPGLWNPAGAPFGPRAHTAHWGGGQLPSLSPSPFGREVPGLLTRSGITSGGLGNYPGERTEGGWLREQRERAGGQLAACLLTHWSLPQLPFAVLGLVAGCGQQAAPLRRHAMGRTQQPGPAPDRQARVLCTGFSPPTPASRQPCLSCQLVSPVKNPLKGNLSSVKGNLM